ncbi:ATP-dependent Zn protease [Kovacikia minuta CCNUW1]|uniref:ATP-dependent Zn protease n=1 Tax=Kovacikia minuta TaxID=2931930 RepID=UPI001CCD6FED|nr:ATP-dependent Zn protease [Kovacikia minuta]UBF26590.1 ATP-dependent Zn protease [Kovacikia minuta CCNUW1]
MSPLSLNLVAIVVALFTFTSLLGPFVHVSPMVPAIAAFGCLGLAALDTWSWQGQGSTLLLDWFAGFSAQHRDRVVRHEAGHFLVAQQLGIPVTGYALNAWEAMRQGHAGNGGVRFDVQEIEAELQQGTLSAQLLDRYCTIWMAGIAAETIVYGNVAGGGDDRQKLRAVLTQLGLPVAAVMQKERLAILQAKTLLQEQESAYEALVEAMTQKASVENCVQAIDKFL